MCLKLTEERPNIYEGWLLAGFGKILRWVERLKKESGTGVEYILAPQVSVFEKPAGLQGIEGADLDFGGQLPVGTFDFPLISVGSAEENLPSCGLLMPTFGILQVRTPCEGLELSFLHKTSALAWW